MSFRLLVRFRGLCVFVPSTAGTRMQVLLRDLRDPGSEFNPHSSCIQFAHRNLWSTTVATHSFIQRATPQAQAGERVSLWFLDRDELEILPGGRRVEVDQLEILSNMEKVARMKDIFVAGRSCDRKFLLTSQKEVSARIKLNKGQISVWNRLLPPSGSVPFIWRFEPNINDSDFHTQELAFIVQLTMQITERFVDIVSKDNKLTLGPSQDGEDVVLWVHNADLDEVVFGVAPQALPEPSAPVNSVHRHFRPFYDLSSGPPLLQSDRPIPRPIPPQTTPTEEDAQFAYRREAGSDIFRFSSTRPSPPCIPTAFAPSPDV